MKGGGKKKGGRGKTGRGKGRKRGKGKGKVTVKGRDRPPTQISGSAPEQYFKTEIAMTTTLCSLQRKAYLTRRL